jgi:hypothetical protein
VILDNGKILNESYYHQQPWRFEKNKFSWGWKSWKTKKIDWQNNYWTSLL